MNRKDYIKTALEHAPDIENIKWNSDIFGFIIQNDFVCSLCAARMMARGCWNFRSDRVLWQGDGPGDDYYCLGCDCKQTQTEKHDNSEASTKTSLWLMENRL